VYTNAIYIYVYIYINTYIYIYICMELQRHGIASFTVPRSTPVIACHGQHNVTHEYEISYRATVNTT